ncbi:hypothetical protein [Burkholderia sp. BDU5]|uniref:hypothetical protein n=1 Tax=Burkholderia sp. BDU5 TaxID=1385590 RepID=UPI0009E767DD|nr:hypothetical protein [Burkholderia sp. BDU5]
MTTTGYAIVENGVVTNVVVWDGNTESWQPPEGTTANVLPPDSPVGVGWTTADGANYMPPPRPDH